MLRRVAKSVGGVTRTFLYDGWAMIQETSGTQTNSYVYGLDLSGSMQGAGTIGGILSASLNDAQAFYFYDANGNVSDLADVSGNSLAHYEWDPYGNATVSTGILASTNPFRFSTKYTDDETGLVYYGYRYYSPGLGRWVSRDPIMEKGGNNIYAFAANDSIGNTDYLGLAWEGAVITGPLPTTGRSWTKCQLKLTMEVVEDCGCGPIGSLYGYRVKYVDATGKAVVLLVREWDRRHEMDHVDDCRRFGYDNMVRYAQANQRCYNTRARAQAMKAEMEADVPLMYEAFHIWGTTIGVDIPVCSRFGSPSCNELIRNAAAARRYYHTMRRHLDSQLTVP
jgi:RHS repeat-associated protein